LRLSVVMLELNTRRSIAGLLFFLGEFVMQVRKVDPDIEKVRGIADKLVENVQRVIVGKKDAVELAVIALISQGHLLIEDAPGVGKTMLARSLARSMNCTFKRIQFTPDMLPGDITGVSVYNQKTTSFEFHPGPIMANIVLADEINRATPKIQSALLECMDERQISVDGVTYKIEAPFHILATQNPLEYEGTFPLPETQLDRFLMRINLGYPTVINEMTIMEQQQLIHPIEKLEPVADAGEIVRLQDTVKKIFVDDLIKKYIALIVEATRKHPAVFLGASPRGSLALFKTAQARALLHGRDYVLPDDVKSLVEVVLAHRIIPIARTARSEGKGTSAGILTEIMGTIPVPGARPN
jgi:MoxR-like ATPase